MSEPDPELIIPPPADLELYHIDDGSVMELVD